MQPRTGKAAKRAGVKGEAASWRLERLRRGTPASGEVGQGKSVQVVTELSGEGPFLSARLRPIRRTPDLPYLAKVVQSVECSTFTR